MKLKKPCDRDPIYNLDPEDTPKFASLFADSIRRDDPKNSFWYLLGVLMDPELRNAVIEAGTDKEEVLRRLDEISCRSIL